MTGLDICRIFIIGVSGKMGAQLVALAAQDPLFSLIGGSVKADSPWLGKDIGSCANLPEIGIRSCLNHEIPFGKCDALIDFTTPETTLEVLEMSKSFSVSHVIGTTGFSKKQEKTIEKFSKIKSIVKSANMSCAVALLERLVALTSSILSTHFDIEICEMHHHQKQDAPSGTAILLAKAAKTGFKTPLRQSMRPEISKKRTKGDIGFACIRGGTIVGEHHVIFAGQHERITLSHYAEDRKIFSHGALRASLWVKTRSPGLYNLHHVLALDPIFKGENP